jgi:hypothetical protein
MLTRVVLQRRVRERPFFFTYAAGALLASSVQLAAYFSPVSYLTYFRISWSAQAFLMVLGFAALFEVLGELVIRYRPQLGSRTKLVLPLAGGIVVLITLSALQMHGTFVQTVLALQNISRWFQVGLLCLVLTTAGFFGLYFRRQTFVIAIGFGTYGLTQALALVLRRYSVIGGEMFNYLDLFGYSCVAVSWMCSLFHREREPVARMLPETSIKEWNQALGELLQR